MVGIPNNYLLDQMNILLELYNQSEYKVDELDSRIKECVLGIDPPCLPLPGIAEISIAVILSELRSFSKFQSPSKVLSFAGLELGYLRSGQSGFTGCMVEHGSPQPSPSHPRQKNARRRKGGARWMDIRAQSRRYCFTSSWSSSSRSSLRIRARALL